MRNYFNYCLVISMLLSSVVKLNAQATINVPASNIFDRNEYNVDINTLKKHGTGWKAALLGLVGIIAPRLNAIDGSFIAQTSGSPNLSNQLVQFQLKSIRGEDPNTFGGNVPNFQNFTTSGGELYDVNGLLNILNGTPAGDIAITYKIPETQYSNNIFKPGSYKMKISHNYQSGFLVSKYFSPNDFYVTLNIPSDIQWITNIGSKNFTVSSLNDFRNAASTVSFDLGNHEIASTLDLKLWAKTAFSTIQFTSSKGQAGTRSVSLFNIASTNPKINSTTLSSTEQDLNSSNNNFIVVTGNRNQFNLRLDVSKANFKSQFYQAGTYKFQLNLNAKSTSGGIIKPQNLEVTLNVNTLSEINIPPSSNIVTFDFNSLSLYQNGKTIVMPNQIRLSNNENYELFVKAETPFFLKSGIQSNLPASTLQVGIDGAPLNITLSNISQKILENGTPILDQDLNMKYTISPSSAQTLISKTPGLYTINVIYSFTAI